MQHAGQQYSQGVLPSQPQYPLPEPTVQVSSSNSITSSLRQWRKKDAGEKKNTTETSATSGSANSGHVARIAPQSHYHAFPSNDVCRYDNSYNKDCNPIYKHSTPPGSVKYSEIVEPSPIQKMDQMTQIVQKQKEKDCMEMNNSLQNNMKQYQDQYAVKHNFSETSIKQSLPESINQPHSEPFKPFTEPIKHAYPENLKQIYHDSLKHTFTESLKESHHEPNMHPHYIPKESQISSHHKESQLHSYMSKDPHLQQYLPKYNIPHAQYSRSYPIEQNNFLMLNKLNPRVAQSFINDPHFRESQVPVLHHNLEQGRSFPPIQRMYNNQAPMPANHNYSSHINRMWPQSYSYPQTYNVMKPNPDPYRLAQYQSGIPRYAPPAEQPLRNCSPRRTFNENMQVQMQMNSSAIPPKISPPIYPPCSQLEYAQHYRHRREQMPEYYSQMSYKPTFMPHSPLSSEVNAENTPTKSNALKQFLENWVDEEIGNLPDVVVPNNVDQEKYAMKPVKRDEGPDTPLYVLDTTEIPSESLPQYMHLQQFEKLPENIKGYYQISKETVGNERAVIQNGYNGNKLGNIHITKYSPASSGEKQRVIMDSEIISESERYSDESARFLNCNSLTENSQLPNRYTEQQNQDVGSVITPQNVESESQKAEKTNVQPQIAVDSVPVPQGHIKGPSQANENSAVEAKNSNDSKELQEGNVIQTRIPDGTQLPQSNIVIIKPNTANSFFNNGSIYQHNHCSGSFKAEKDIVRKTNQTSCQFSELANNSSEPVINNTSCMYSNTTVVPEGTQSILPNQQNNPINVLQNIVISPKMQISKSSHGVNISQTSSDLLAQNLESTRKETFIFESSETTIATNKKEEEINGNKEAQQLSDESKISETASCDLNNCNISTTDKTIEEGIIKQICSSENSQGISNESRKEISYASAVQTVSVSFSTDNFKKESVQLNQESKHCKEVANENRREIINSNSIPHETVIVSHCSEQNLRGPGEILKVEENTKQYTGIIKINKSNKSETDFEINKEIDIKYRTTELGQYAEDSNGNMKVGEATEKGENIKIPMAASPSSYVEQESQIKIELKESTNETYYDKEEESEVYKENIHNTECINASVPEISTGSKILKNKDYETDLTTVIVSKTEECKIIEESNQNTLVENKCLENENPQNNQISVNKVSEGNQMCSDFLEIGDEENKNLQQFECSEVINSINDNQTQIKKKQDKMQSNIEFDKKEKEIEENSNHTEQENTKINIANNSLKEAKCDEQLKSTSEIEFITPLTENVGDRLNFNPENCDSASTKNLEMEDIKENDSETLDISCATLLISNETVTENEYKKAYRIEEKNVLLQIAEELLEINVIEQNGKKVIVIKGLTDAVVNSEKSEAPHVDDVSIVNATEEVLDTDLHNKQKDDKIGQKSNHTNNDDEIIIQNEEEIGINIECEIKVESGETEIQFHHENNENPKIHKKVNRNAKDGDNISQTSKIEHCSENNSKNILPENDECTIKNIKSGILEHPSNGSSKRVVNYVQRSKHTSDTVKHKDPNINKHPKTKSKESSAEKSLDISVTEKKNNKTVFLENVKKDFDAQDASLKLVLKKCSINNDHEEYSKNNNEKFSGGKETSENFSVQKTKAARKTFEKPCVANATTVKEKEYEKIDTEHKQLEKNATKHTSEQSKIRDERKKIKHNVIKKQHSNSIALLSKDKSVSKQSTKSKYKTSDSAAEPQSKNKEKLAKENRHEDTKKGKHKDDGKIKYKRSSPVRQKSSDQNKKASVPENSKIYRNTKDSVKRTESKEKVDKKTLLPSAEDTECYENKETTYSQKDFLLKPLKIETSNANMPEKQKSVQKKNSTVKTPRHSFKKSLSEDFITHEVKKVEEEIDMEMVHQEIVIDFDSKCNEIKFCNVGESDFEIRNFKNKTLDEDAQIKVQEHSITSSTSYDPEKPEEDYENRILENSNKRRLSLEEYNKRKRKRRSVDTSKPELSPKEIICNLTDNLQLNVSHKKQKTENDSVDSSNSESPSTTNSFDFQKKEVTKSNISAPVSSSESASESKCDADVDVNATKSCQRVSEQQQHSKWVCEFQQKNIETVNNKMVREYEVLMQRFLNQERLSADEFKKVKQIIKYKRWLEQKTKEADSNFCSTQNSSAEITETNSPGISFKPSIIRSPTKISRHDRNELKLDINANERLSFQRECDSNESTNQFNTENKNSLCMSRETKFDIHQNKVDLTNRQKELQNRTHSHQPNIPENVSISEGNTEKVPEPKEKHHNRKRFRNLYTGEDSDCEIITTKLAKDGASKKILSKKPCLDKSIKLENTNDYSVQSDSQRELKLIFKRSISVNMSNLQPIVMLERSKSLDEFAKRYS